MLRVTGRTKKPVTPKGRHAQRHPDPRDEASSEKPVRLLRRARALSRSQSTTGGRAGGGSSTGSHGKSKSCCRWARIRTLALKAASATSEIRARAPASRRGCGPEARHVKCGEGEPLGGLSSTASKPSRANGTRRSILAKLAPAMRARTLIRLEQDVFPWLGGLPVGEIKAPQLLQDHAPDRSARRHRDGSSCVAGMRSGIPVCDRDRPSGT